MKLSEIKTDIPDKVYSVLDKGLKKLRPAQEKAVRKGLLDGKSLLLCTPTASGKTLVAEMAFTKAILEGKGKAVYIVPLKALASEKFKDFKNKYGTLFRIALSIGDVDSTDSYLADYDLIITTSEKLDSLTRHHAPWLTSIAVVIIDEIHLLNDPGRGPTLEILLTILKELIPKSQFIGLSATIGNPEQLAEWLGADLVQDDWRPVELRKGILHKGEVEFFE